MAGEILLKRDRYERQKLPKAATLIFSYAMTR